MIKCGWASQDERGRASGGKFTFHTDAKYLTSDKYLKTGDTQTTVEHTLKISY